MTPAVESTREEIEPYALRLKARLESDRKRRQHRSLMQLESLVDELGNSGSTGVLDRHVGTQAHPGCLLWAVW
ncbi:MAG: hypothetical protein SGPRY_003595 [Prymnesium sp.]